MKIFLLTIPRRYFFSGSFLLFDFLCRVCRAFASVHCCLVVTCWEKADLLFVMFNCVFVTFPCGILGQVWYLIVLIPELCHISYLAQHLLGIQETQAVIDNSSCSLYHYLPLLAACWDTALLFTLINSIWIDLHKSTNQALTYLKFN